MTENSISQAKKYLADLVKNRIAEQFSDSDIELKQQLVDVFWSQIALEEWRHKEPNDIAGCCETLWMLLKATQVQPKVQVLNPVVEEHGWVCPGTVIMICQRDMPFLVDSVRLELNRRSLQIHAIKSTLLAVKRNTKGKIEALQAPEANAPPKEGWVQEALMYVEVGLMADAIELMELKEAIKEVLDNVALVVGDYPSILEATGTLKAQLLKAGADTEKEEVCEFITWLENSHFTFLGYREFDCAKNEADQILLTENKDKQLGLFKKYCADTSEDKIATDATVAFYQNSECISISKSSTRSSVHRSVYPDYIVIKRYSADGAVIGEARILGLFTYAVYTLNTYSIPIIRHKVKRILEKSKLLPQSHDGKNLLRVIETYPRDELFQADFNTLYDAVIRVALINEKGAVCLIMRTDAFNNFVNCIAYVPRDSYNTKVRQNIERLVGAVIDSEELDSTTYFSESVLARAYMVFRLKEGAQVNYDVPSLESSVNDLARGWDVRLGSSLTESFGEREGQALYHRFKTAFSMGYQEHFDPRTAVADIQLLQQLNDESDIAMHFFQPTHAQSHQMRFKVLHLNSALELSDVVPILEHLGLRVLAEHPYELKLVDYGRAWLHDFHLKFGLDCNLEVATVSKLFEGAFAAIWRGDADSDGFNRLVLGARLDWREVAMLRAYAAYMKQTTFAFSQDYIADTLVNQAEITRNLVALFKTAFDPRVNAKSEGSTTRFNRLEEKIVQSLEAVENLNEDKIIRRYLELIKATLRTNFYQLDIESNYKQYLSFKFSPQKLADIPSPKPKFEVYVYSPRMEGVHLRGGLVARGGIRWSDRLQDYRTEVLGLVKAQQVKNAVIVPTGAKGGFICKKQSALTDRDAIMAEGIECYKTLMRGLLDITDNILEGEVVGPENVICKDESDPYLVVAADKGTATFSDIANAVSEDYGHWLGDAFASGGSQGYDHKKMGITAKGAWVSVQRHFREIGIDVQEDPFTVIGIGDMAGDVFGNGMLLSNKIRLVAAFNHAHIFVDPEPDCEKSFAERKRLFELPRSSWADYDKACISKGGGVFSRAAKSISLTPEMQSALHIKASALAPTEFIKHLLQAPVDLIWNGGIGTYVKSSEQTHAEVGDKANDMLRVDGKQLQCKVFGEGGNLGMTQLGRVEFALNGGACNTDFIDNAAGVDCSDHEVNIKILLQGITGAGDLTLKQRNKLLEDMTEAVAHLVLNNNYRQTMALSMVQHQVHDRTGEFKRFIKELESRGRLDRALEFLPEEEKMNERERQGLSFTRPELSVLLSYAKVELKEAFVKADLTTDALFSDYIESAFPQLLIDTYPQQVLAHPLAKEIAATQVANDMVHILGITAAQRLAASSGAPLKQVAIAFVMAKKIFKIDEFIAYIKSLDNKMPSAIQYELLNNMSRRVRRGTRWFLRNRRGEFNPEKEAAFFAAGIEALNAEVGQAFSKDVKEHWQNKVQELTELGVEPRWVQQLAVPDYLFSGVSAVEVAAQFDQSPAIAGVALFCFYEHFELHWLAEALSLMPVTNAWQAKARETFIDELDSQLRKLIAKLFTDQNIETVEDVNAWIQQNSEAARRWLSLVEDVKQEGTLDFAVFSVLVGELIDFASNRISISA